MVPELGIGLVYWPELDAIFEDTGLVGVLEIEPQGFWEKVVGPEGIQYQPNETLLWQATQYPQAKLLHGVGQPVGGTVDDPVSYVGHLKRAVDLFDPAWISEHLSFSRTSIGNECQEAGFLLPPRQTDAGVNLAVHNIGRLSQGIGRPFAFETGVNYLKPRGDELSDGAFFGEIARRAECGILLDLHNLWCNERNGRQPVRDALTQMPLEQVWELHLAGGMEYQGFWLDAHSDLVPAPVMDLAAQIIPSLPNLGAIIFEILPQHLSRVSVDEVHRQMEALSGLWPLKPVRTMVAGQGISGYAAERHAGVSASDYEEVVAWEASLVAAIRGGHAFFAGCGGNRASTYYVC